MFSGIRQELKNLKTDKRTLKNFAILFFVVLCLLSLLFYLRGRSYFIWTIFAAAIFIFLGLLAPKSLKWFYRIWMMLAFTLGSIMTRVILSLAFFVIMTPLGLFLKMIGKDLLDQRIDGSRDTYWKRHEVVKDKNRYLKPF